MNLQSVASIVRQLAAVAATVIGVLSASGTGLHLSPAVEAILTAAGPLVIAIEHYVADPSTGTTTPTPAPKPTATSVGSPATVDSAPLPSFPAA